MEDWSLSMKNRLWHTVKDSETSTKNNLKKLYDPFLWLGIICLRVAEPLRVDTLTTKLPGIPDKHLIDLERWNVELPLKPTSAFELGTSKLGIESSALTTRPSLHNTR